MSKAKALETLTLTPVAQKTIELALKLSHTPESLLFAVVASQERDPLLVVERREGAIRATGRGAQSTPKAFDQEGVHRFTQQVGEFGEPANVIALGIIRPQSPLSERSAVERPPLYPSEGETDLLNLVRANFPQATWQLIADMTDVGPTVTANNEGDLFRRQSAILSNEPLTPIEFPSHSPTVPRRAGRLKKQ